MFPIEWSYMEIVCLKTLTPEQNGCHFGHDTFKYLLLNETINFHRRVQLTINQHWLGLWLDPQQATRPTMNKWWHSSLTHIWVNTSDYTLKLHRRYKQSNDCLNGLCILLNIDMLSTIYPEYHTIKLSVKRTLFKQLLCNSFCNLTHLSSLY